MKTKACILTQLNAPLEIWELEIPSLKEGQVLVKIAYTGACHSQLNEIKGLKGEDAFLPHTLGHEGSGIVEAVGNNVTKVKPSDHVVLTWIKAEGANVASAQYKSARGAVNSGAISTFMTYAIISENRVIPIPKAMPLKEAALLGCAIPTGAGVVKNEMQLKESDSFAVYGAGGVGLSALLAAKQAKAYPRIAVDVQAHKLEKAKQLGATHTVDARATNPAEAIKLITKGQGVDFVFESAGKKQAMEQAYSSLKAPGLCVLAGNLPKGERISIDPFDLIVGKKIVGTWGGKSSIDQDVADYVALYLKGELDLAALITHEHPLEEINALFELLERGEVGRGLLCCFE
ncbi:MAG: Aryl-alcohol dehydrogenase [Chlamydiales bacterium]|nr:Aryl-alcohol dehydrogenase [Chlamydiales bacterium]